ncbi:loricrin-like [Olea europaea var. sylvestris]|uniref:loricrin-like n=1 Tax=Olea europaea var. sylvestris TaxID=158386 RepID=UPI000C1D18E2|nr:loricrin-like [Olea europaea var. sylvestris]
MTVVAVATVMVGLGPFLGGDGVVEMVVLILSISSGEMVALAMVMGLCWVGVMLRHRRKENFDNPTITRSKTPAPTYYGGDGKDGKVSGIKDGNMVVLAGAGAAVAATAATAAVVVAADESERDRDRDNQASGAGGRGAAPVTAGGDGNSCGTSQGCCCGGGDGGGCGCGGGGGCGGGCGCGGGGGCGGGCGGTDSNQSTTSGTNLKLPENIAADLHKSESSGTNL